MSNKIFFSILTPEKPIMESLADMIVVPGEEGDFGVLPQHAPLVSILRTGLLTVYNQSEIHYIFISAGFVEIKENHCIVLAENCEFVENMNYAEIEMHLHTLQEEINIAQTEKDKTSLLEAQKSINIKKEIFKNIFH